MFFGMDNNSWYVGIVEDINDLEKLGRVRVRCIGIHTDDKTLLPTDDLPWAQLVYPVTSASISGIGESHGIINGSTVVGFFQDGELRQQPIILGTLAGKTSENVYKDRGFSDPDNVYPREDYLNESDLPRTARAENLDDTYVNEEESSNVDAGYTSNWETPTSEYSAQYPFNRVKETESGHLEEWDDTPGRERIHFRHRTGTDIEIYPSGSKVEKIVSDGYTIIAGSNFVEIQENKTETINGNLQVIVKGSVEMLVEGNLSTKVRGNLCEYIEGDAVRTVKGKNIVQSEGMLALAGSPIHFNPDFDLSGDDLCPALKIESIDEALQDDEPGTKVALSESDKAYLEERSKVDPVTLTAEETLDENNSIDEEVFCDTIPADWTYETELVPSVTIADLSTRATFPHSIQSQNGLSEEEILCNLKGLAQNILLPIYKKYGRRLVTINSGFRSGTSSSQHNKGQAVDLQFVGWDGEDYLAATKYIASNLPVDQIILEKGKSWWIHISYKPNGRRQTLTLNPNTQKFETGLKLYS